MLDEKERYKIEYSETGNLRRHYSTIRSALSTFGITISLASFANFSMRENAPSYLIFIGYFMLAVSVIACLAFSLRTERTNLYLDMLWAWFSDDSSSSVNAPGSFSQFQAKPSSVFWGMLCDEMNWIMMIAASCVVVFFNVLK